MIKLTRQRENASSVTSGRRGETQPKESPLHHGHSLLAVVTWIVVLITGAAMLVYALFQHSTTPHMSWWRLLTEHAWHVLVLGGLTYAALYFLLQRNVVEPIRELYVKLYAISRGDNRPIAVQTNVREIRDIAESVNLMLSQLQVRSHHPWGIKLRGGAKGLRSLAGRTLPTLEADDRQNLASLAAEMEELAGVFERSEARDQHSRHEPVQ